MRTGPSKWWPRHRKASLGRRHRRPPWVAVPARTPQIAGPSGAHGCQRSSEVFHYGRLRRAAHLNPLDALRAE